MDQGVAAEALMVNIQDSDHPDVSDFTHKASLLKGTRSSPTTGSPTMVPIAPKRLKLDDSADSLDLDSTHHVSPDSQSNLTSGQSLPLIGGQSLASAQSIASAQLCGEIDPEELKNNKDPNMNYYSCTQCNKYFWTENSMRHHFSMYHSEKAFVCEICGKAFRFRSNLAEHRSVHTSLKPYVCKYCGKSSRLKGNLTKHILKHHKVETNAVVGKEDIIIKKGKKSVKDPKCIDFLQKSMIVLTAPPDSPDMHGSPGSTGSSASSALAAMASQFQHDSPVMNLSRMYKHGRESGGSDDSGTIQNSINAIIEKGLGVQKEESLPVVRGEDYTDIGNSGSSTPGFEGESGGLEDCLGPDGISGVFSNNTRCPICNKHFRKASQFQDHMKSHHGATSCQGSIMAIPERAKPNGLDLVNGHEKPMARTPITRPMGAPTVSVTPTNGASGSPAITYADSYGSHNGTPNGFPRNGPGNADTVLCFSQKLNNLAGCQKDIQEIKELLGALKASYAAANATKNGFSTAQPKIESLLTSLDNRVSRVERQMEASLSTLGTLIQVQTSMNLAMSQFRMEIMAKVAALAEQLKPIASSLPCASPNGV